MKTLWGLLFWAITIGLTSYSMIYFYNNEPVAFVNYTGLVLIAFIALLLVKSEK
jgi:hypothetical protein